jgi:hypothetical protein
MQIKPIQEDVDWAVDQNQWACVVVRSIQRQIPTSTFVKVNKDEIAYTDKGHRYYHSTPQEMIEDIIKPFDQHRPEDIKLGEYPLVVARTKQADKMTPEKREQLRKIDRDRTRKAHKETNPNRVHNRFCDEPEVDE